MDGVNLAALTENAARLGMRIQETLHEHTRDLSISRGGASLFDLPDDRNIGHQLESSNDREKLEAMKRLIALTSKGRNVSAHFPQVVKNVASPNLEVRKLVYIYLLRYAAQEPDVALLSINTFQKDLADPSPLIRAMALRVLSGINVPMIGNIVTLAIRRCAVDISPYVRKAAALAIPKMHRLDPSQQPSLIAVISALLRDRSPLSIGSAVIAFESVCPTRLDLLHQQYRRLCGMLVEVDEWGQVDLLNLLLRYARTMLPKPTLSSEGESEDLDKDQQLLLSSAEPLFQSRNPAVVLAVVRVFYYAGSPSSLNTIVNPLLRILRSSKETERVVLAYLLVVAREHPHLFVSRYTRFLVSVGDSRQVKSDKIKVLLALCTPDNHQALLREFIDYADDPDDTVVGDAVNAIGQCARRVPACAQQCISALLTMIKSRHEFVVSRAILVLKSLVQNQLHDAALATASSSQQQSPLNIISQLAHRIDDIRHPQARACVLWLVGQYCPAEGESTAIDGIADWAPDVLRKAAKQFSSQARDCAARLQTLTLAAKLFVLCPTSHTLELLCRYVFSLGRYDVNYDVRDRTRMLTSLLAGISPQTHGLQGDGRLGDGVVLRREQVRKVLFEGKAGIVDDEPHAGHDHLIGSLGLLTGKEMCVEDTPLPQWLEAGIDPALRDNDEDEVISEPNPPSMPFRPVALASVTSDNKFVPAGSAQNRPATDARTDLDKFYASDSEESVADSASEEEESEDEDHKNDGDDRSESSDGEGEEDAEEGRY